jgi:transcriptional regulator with XRE-family HTH domain
MMPTETTFRRQQIRALREGLGLSQAEFAARLGVTKQAVSRWETGLSEPSVAHLVKLVNVTGARLDSFFG